jgi:hypothetical protein
VLQVPIYVSSIMASRANAYFKLLQNWASERVKQAAPGCRAAAFDFSRVQDWQPELIDKPVRVLGRGGGEIVDTFKANPVYRYTLGDTFTAEQSLSTPDNVD